MKDYFEGCKTAEDVKKIYKKLARELHPDCNPDRDTTADFQKMNMQYEKAWERCKNYHTNAQGETYEKQNDTSAAEYADLINTLIHIPEIVIELIGSWVWVSGNTFPAKKILKSLDFKYSKLKKAWYYHEADYHKKSKKNFTLDDIRKMYHTTAFEKGEKEKEEKEALPA